MIETRAGIRSAEREETPTDEELVGQARAGNHAAFRTLVERYRKGVTAMAVGMLGPSSQVDDVVQETFIRFYQSLDRYRTDASVGTYLKRIAINQTLDILRRRKGLLSRFLSRDDEAITLPEPALDENGKMDERERNAVVHQAIALLPEKQRAVVLLRMIDGCSTEETATTLGIAYGTVLSRLNRGQDRLRELLAPYMNEIEGAVDMISGREGNR